MATTQKLGTGLNPIQISLLRLFSRPMSEKDVLTLKKMMVDYYSALLEKEVTTAVSEKGYTQDDFDKMLNGEN